MDGAGAVSGRRQLVRETRIRVRARRGVALALILLFPGGRDEVYGRGLHLFSAASGIVLDFICDLGNDPGYRLVNDREKLGHAGICRLSRE
jgi:hypothetical protein